MNRKKKLNIHYFGTCRIHAPLKFLNDSGLINLLNNEWSFFHTTKEVLQAIQVINGEKKFDNADEGVLAGFPKYRPEFESSVCLGDADIVFIEISSLKIFRLGTSFMQLNRIREATVSRFNELECWFKTLEKQGVGVLPPGKKLSDYNVNPELLQCAQCSTIDEEGLLKDLSEIADLIPSKVVLVNCFNYKTRGGLEYLAPRVIVQEALDKFCHENILGRVNPTHLLEVEGFDENTKDSAHYQDDFIPKVSDYFYKHLRGFS